MGWTERNLATQGYCLPAAEASRLRLALRFPTGLCLALVVVALALQSAPFVAALAGVGLVAGWTSRHPFDHLWNRIVAPLSGSAELPPNPRRRRHAFKLATFWLATVAALFAAGANGAALALGGVLVAVCGLVTATNFCIPSTLLSLWERRNAKEAVA